MVSWSVAGESPVLVAARAGNVEALQIILQIVPRAVHTLDQVILWIT